MTGSGSATTAVEPLAGYTVAFTADGRQQEFGSALERCGAKVIQAPAIRIVPLADDARLRKATESCLAAPVDIVVATTGIGFRGWIDAAETWGLADRQAHRDPAARRTADRHGAGSSRRRSTAGFPLKA